MSQHTPGDWIVGPTENGRRRILGPATGFFQALVVAEVLTGNVADDYLIAAAPDLLAALEAVMVGQLGGNPDMDAQRFRDARAAIAKATRR